LTSKKYDFRHIRVVRDDDPSLPPVCCSGSQIEQVVLNLLKNSAQAMAYACTPSPEITVRTGEDRGRAQIVVTDNGPGIDEATRLRVFEPFFTTKAAGEGTGLGLSVVYFIVVEQHGGSMAVESSPNQGTTVILRIPFE
jgi:signal transduction histidine kinase